MKIARKNVFAFLIISFVFLLAGYFSNVYISPAKAQSTSNKYFTGYAWSDNIGWISFATSTNGNNQVTIDSSTGDLNGYAWSDNIGWVKFGGLSGFPGSGSNANFNGSNITGWARACAGTINSDCNSSDRTDGWDGWINFYNLSKDPSNNISGYAWGSDVVGWINFGADSGFGGVSIVDPTPACPVVANSLSLTRGSSVYLAKADGVTVTVSGLPNGVTYNASNGYLGATSNASTTSGQNITVAFSAPCSQSGTTTSLAVLSQAPVVTLRACKAAGQCKDADGSIIVPKNGTINLTWSVAGSSLACSGSSIFGSPVSTSSSATTNQLQSTQSYSISCTNTSTGEVSTKTIRAVVYSVSEF